MPRRDDKRFYRDLKRTIKKLGTRRRRHAEKRALEEHPEEAHRMEYEYGGDSSEWLNGLDHDKTREREGRPGRDRRADGGDAEGG